MSDHGHDAHGHGHGEMGHVSPISQLVLVFSALIVLTVITVVVSKGFNLGWLSLAVAMLVATMKGTLVCLYFMHLRYDRPFNAIAFCSGFIFLGLFLFFAMTDSGQYQRDIERFEADYPAAPTAPAAAS
jgi:cytochrome c oxidase subunit 4